MKEQILLTFFTLHLLIIQSSCEDVHTTKLFIFRIDPIKFNWTIHSGDDFEYRASLINAPDLPKWIDYLYSERHHTGFLYGVPPKEQSDIEIEIIGLNRRTYETRRRVVHLNVVPKTNVALRHVHLKIDNLNVEDLFDRNRMTRLLDIFRFKLWKESISDLYETFLKNAVSLGARLPLLPNEGEGVVVRLGSRAPFSNKLLELQEEVRPLSKLQSCPREYKRTTVERLFRDEGFKLDWCSFKLIDDSAVVADKSSETMYDSPVLPELDKEAIWTRPTKAQVSQRNYAGEFAFTILVPMLIMICLVVVLSFILGFQRQGMAKRNPEEIGVETTSDSQKSTSGFRESTPDLNGRSRFRNASPQVAFRTSAINGHSRPTPPPYAGTMRTAVVDF